MTVITRDAERARLFQTGRAQTRQINRGSTTLELAETQVALQHYKTKLLTALQTQDQTAINQALDQLITLRSTQTALTLKQIKESGQELTPFIIQTERERYYTDCAQLIAAASL